MSFSIIFFILFSQRILLDKIVATVDSEIITLRELKSAYFLHICTKVDKNPKGIKDCLDELIDFSIIQREITEREEIREEDYIEEEERIISELGGLDMVLQILNELDMSWDEFRAYLSRKIISKKLTVRLFSSRVSVGLDEIEKYYKEKYLPLTERIKIEAHSLIEMTPLIEKEIVREKIKSFVDEWLKERRVYHEINVLLTENDIRDILKSFR